MKKYKKFTWGSLLEEFEYNFDGEVMRVTKYHPWVVDVGGTIRTGESNKNSIMYHCEELSESADNIVALIISWLTYKCVGLNQHALVAGICRALRVV